MFLLKYQKKMFLTAFFHPLNHALTTPLWRCVVIVST